MSQIIPITFKIIFTQPKMREALKAGDYLWCQLSDRNCSWRGYLNNCKNRRWEKIDTKTKELSFQKQETWQFWSCHLYFVCIVSLATNKMMERRPTCICCNAYTSRETGCVRNVKELTLGQLAIRRTHSIESSTVIYPC